MTSHPGLSNAGKRLAKPNRYRGGARLHHSLPARLLRLRLCPYPRTLGARRFRRALRSAKDTGWQIAHGRALEFTCCAPRTFLATVSAVAEQSRDRFPPPQKVHLKSVRLFLGAWFGVDATDVLLGVGISSFFHWSCA